MSKKIKGSATSKAIESYDVAGRMVDKVLVFKPSILGPLWLTGIIIGMALFACVVMR